MEWNKWGKMGWNDKVNRNPGMVMVVPGDRAFRA